MNCHERQQQIVLLSYDELPGTDRADLEAHLKECVACRDALVDQRQLDQFLSEEPELDLPADLLVESRRSLDDALDRIEARRSWWRIPEFSVVFRPMKLLESAALVALGLACGVYVAQQRGTAVNNSNEAGILGAGTAIPSNATVNFHIVRPGPAGTVLVAGEVVQPYKREGTVKDQVVRQLLLGALQDTSNPGARLNAVEILAQQPFDQGVKEGLVHALTQDPVAGVRMKALESLKAFSSDTDVRAALVQTLRTDEVPGIRAGAIEALMQYSKDDTVAQAMEEVAREDDNAYVRMIGTRFVGKGR
ncbi:MAG TPA: HEAT repeat domain-containing protein [Terriglobia bacterium]|nr:HEAT repeat domain-containing protein [Terriglobia bacterium]